MIDYFLQISQQNHHRLWPFLQDTNLMRGLSNKIKLK